MIVGLERPFRIATVGAAFTANKGAASMLHAIIDTVPRRVGPSNFVVLSTYPDDDEAALGRREGAHDNVRIAALRPRELVFPVLPLCLLVWLLRQIGHGAQVVAGWNRSVEALYEADLVLDLAGVSFVDGRGFPILVYNVLMTGVGLLAGTPVIKCSQALGPFKNRANHHAAGAVLPRLEAVIARGKQTRQHLDALSLKNAHEAADCAFLLQVGDQADDMAREMLGPVGIGGPYLSLVPSEVVNGYCRARSIDYVSILEAACRIITNEHRLPIVILAHSARPGHAAGRMNDLPLVATLGERLSDVPSIVAVAEDIEPAVLRAMIGASKLCITSRFHAMISSLERGVPTLVVGWSHKYAEVLKDFDLEEWALTYEDIDADVLADRVRDLRATAEDVRATIARRLPGVIRRAEQNLAVIEAALSPRLER